MKAVNTAQTGGGGFSGELAGAVQRYLFEAFGMEAAEKDVMIPHRLGDAAVRAAAPPLFTEDGFSRRVAEMPRPKLYGEELFSLIRLRGGTVCFRLNDRCLEAAAAEKAKTLPEPVIPDEVAIPASGAAPDEGACAYALALAVCGHRSGRPYAAESAHDALLRCLLLHDRPDDKALLAGAVRAVLKGFQNGLFGGEAVLAMAKILNFCETKNN